MSILFFNIHLEVGLRSACLQRSSLSGQRGASSSSRPRRQVVTTLRAFGDPVPQGGRWEALIHVVPYLCAYRGPGTALGTEGQFELHWALIKEKSRKYQGEEIEWRKGDMKSNSWTKGNHLVLGQSDNLWRNFSVAVTNLTSAIHNFYIFHTCRYL